MTALSSLPWVGILVATLLCFFFGALWFGPINGKKWMKAVGVTQADIDREAKNRPKLMVLEFLSNFIMVFMLSIVMMWANPQTFMQAMHIGVILWLGFCFTKIFSAKLWKNISNDLMVIEMGHSLIAILIACGALFLL